MVDTGMEGHNNLIFTFCYVHKNYIQINPLQYNCHILKFYHILFLNIN